MKTKKLFLMAAMLLTSMFAFAQGENNEPLKGDVNGDGKVDVADITAIIAIIMNNTSQTTYYWYVGNEIPTSISGTADYNNGGGWTSTGNSVPDQIYQLVKGFDSSKELYAIVPITSGTTLKPVASDMSTIDTSVPAHSTISYGNVDYQVYTYGDGSTRKTIMFAKK